jgi:hypothetical protein
MSMTSSGCDCFGSILAPLGVASPDDEDVHFIDYTDGTKGRVVQLVVSDGAVTPLVTAPSLGSAVAVDDTCVYYIEEICTGGQLAELRRVHR